MNTEKNNWRKSLASVTRYIYSLESLVTKNNVTIAEQKHTINELRRRIEYQNGALTGGHHECC
jgi:hypothetical protein